MSAYITDLIFADPQWMPHPVRVFGLVTAAAERICRGIANTDRGLLFAGFAAAGGIAVGSAVGAWWILTLIGKVSPLAGSALTIYLAYSALSVRGLDEAGREVVNHLRSGRLESARSSLSMIVGRDTRHLDEPEILRAVIETVSENSSDGVVAPMFYLAIGGVPAALAYKAINTMDSMIAHKNERYLYFGRGAARLDDIANFLPARLTAVLVTVAAFLLNMSWRKAFHTAVRDGRLQPSPNSGYPESAFAGALRIQLGGVDSYDGEQIQKPFIGDPERRLTLDLYSSVRRLLYATSALMVALSTGIIATLHGVT
jgi:adenosylcobinamide-phosphate synthase